MLDYTLCNELLADEGRDLGEQARIAAALGYSGLELAPATLGEAPHDLTAQEITRIRATIEAEGIRVTGLHWLLSGYPDLSITDPAKQGRAQAILLKLVDLCAALGGDVLIHGSPKQRVRPEGMDDAAFLALLAEFFAPVAEAAESSGVTYCIEPLSQAEDDAINTVAQGAELARAIGNPAFRTMIDISASGQTEPPVADLIRHWVPTGMIGHIHANDTNRGAPGMGDDPFPQIVAALVETGWARPVGVEPFRTLIDAPVTAATGIATLRACERACS
ncbi:sugar phosphate isomerase/epimerase family protein [Poseidonocella sedimentorum]|uniref:Sugar phosphate isomerase/epimerase n=1 Tax=Poseidonocella sedimentorum TaxID=871652 RepID=A0A1I6D7V4_9RHOB|nr:sugar phosphate isomerase/epimerase family protein [Poseidonocella sedimentorum]SFR01524.1 Sugar phosphate isomerase/epimerase [Poseidonocella sedimentorum]